jgi:hypothetical protein
MAWCSVEGIGMDLFIYLFIHLFIHSSVKFIVNVFYYRCSNNLRHIVASDTAAKFLCVCVCVYEDVSKNFRTESITK